MSFYTPEFMSGYKDYVKGFTAERNNSEYMKGFNTARSEFMNNQCYSLDQGIW